MNDKVLISGAYGFLGSYIRNAQIEAGNQIETLGRDQRNNYIIDLSANRNIQIDSRPHHNTVIHNAGVAHSVKDQTEQRKLMHAVNYEGTQRLLEILQKRPPQKFIFISTVAVYGKEEGVNISEETCPNPKDDYGSSKYAAEQLIEKWARNNEVNLSIYRLPLVVGKYAPGSLSQMISAIKKGYFFTIGSGNAKKSMVLAKDVARLTTRPTPYGIYNLTDGEHPSFRMLSDAIAMQLGVRKPIQVTPAIAKFLGILGDIIRSSSFNTRTFVKLTSELTFDDDKARKTLGWKPCSVLSSLEELDLINVK